MYWQKEMEERLNVFVTRKIPQVGLDMLKEHADVVVSPQ